MKVTLTGKLSKALRKATSTKMEAEDLVKFYEEGRKRVDWDRVEKEDKAETGDYLSSNRIKIGEDVEEELKAISDESDLTPGEIFRIALWKGLRHFRTYGKNLTFKDRETPIPQ